MKLTYYGHSCFGVVVDGTHLLFDPFITANPLASSIDVEQIPADYILVSHGHFDHVDDVERIARRTGATLVANYEIVQWFAKHGVEKAHAMNLGGAFTPYAISDLGDLRIHGKGDFNDDNFYRFDAVTVTVVPEPATIAALLGLAALGFVAWRRRR